MKTIGCATPLLAAMMLTCCGAGSLDTRALGAAEGVSMKQVLSSAKVVLAGEGFTLELCDESTGLLRTEWKRRGRRMVRYEVSVSHGRSGDGMRLGDAEVSVSAAVRDRVLDGWSDEYAARMESAAILDEIVERISLRQEDSTYRVRLVRSGAGEGVAKAADDAALPAATSNPSKDAMDIGAGDAAVESDAGSPMVEP